MAGMEHRGPKHGRSPVSIRVVFNEDVFIAPLLSSRYLDIK